MSSPESTGGKSSEQRLNHLFDSCVKVTGIIFRIFIYGFKSLPFRRIEFYVYLLSGVFLIYAIAFSGKHLEAFSLVFPGAFTEFVIQKLQGYSPWLHFGVLCLYGLGILLLFFGIRPFYEWKRYQRAIDCLALKSGLGTSPRLKKIQNDGPYRLKLTIQSEGIGIDRYETKKGDFESAVGAVIDKFGTGANPKYVEVMLAKRRLPLTCQYKDLLLKLKKPYFMSIGESIGGTITQCIRDLPHMLIAGTTGGGKSVFFKQILMCILKTSSHIQMYLLDLKGGVEMKEFSVLPNVVLAKDEKHAVLVLQRLKAEMERRFEYMEKHGYKKIEPERDKMDLIVVGVDEASVLYTRPSRRSVEGELIEQARELTDHLAKLARAAGIHLILATQKVSKETIDTKIQENIGGRMCFRMNTLQGSLTVLGNKMAFELPDHPGRAIWSAGNQFIEVQAPLIQDEEIVRECEVIRFEYEQGKRNNFQDLLFAQGKVEQKAEEVVDVKESQAA